MPSGTLNVFPFAAFVGAEHAKHALECAAVSPRIRTVLIYGGQGTGKSVLSRSLAELVDGDFVNCPPTATEDRLFGDLDIEETIRSGKTAIEEGLLQKADGKVLFIDDFGIMERRLQEEVLDSVLEGTVRIERGTVSSVNPCRTTLIATADPEGEELSLHILDRFDLCAYIGETAEDQRKLIAERGLRFSVDPDRFRREFGEETSEERVKLLRAKDILPLVNVSDGLVSVIAELCTKINTDGSRGDLALYNCSCALAALDGRDEVLRKDVEEAASLCLPHRRREQQTDNPSPPSEDGDGDAQQQDGSDGPVPQDDGRDGTDLNDGETSGEDKNGTAPIGSADLEEMLFEIGRQFRVIDYLYGRDRMHRVRSRGGRRSSAESTDGTGRYVRYKVPDGRPRDIAFDATVRAAAPYQRTRGSNGLAISIEKNDIRTKVRERPSGTTLLFLVDASGSLGVRRRMAAVKGAVLSMLRDSYVKRDRIGLMAFRKDTAELVLPPTGSAEYGYRCLEDLPTGGRTPLGTALLKARDYMSSYAAGRSGEKCYIVLVTDGRANVPVRDGKDANAEAAEIAENVSMPSVKWIVVDAESGFPHFGYAAEIARRLNARYFRLEDLDADRLAEAVRTATDRWKTRIIYPTYTDMTLCGSTLSFT